MDNLKFLGKILDWDCTTNKLTIQVDFVDPDRMQSLEDLCKNKDMFSFVFKKPFRKLKTYPQLKKYYKMITTVLFKFLKYKPKAEEIKAFDEDIKKSAMPCKVIDVGGNEVYVVPSKADMTVEEMAFLIQVVQERYASILEGDDNNEIN